MPGSVASRRERAWALGLALLASLALLAISQTLLAWMTGPAAGLRLAPAAVVLAGLTALAHLGILRMSARTAPIDEAAELAVRTLVLAPPLAALVVVPAMWGSTLFATSIPALLPQIGPLLCAVWAAALFVTPLVAALLRRIAAVDRCPPDEVASRWTGLFAACAAASALVALGRGLARGLEDAPPAGLGHVTLLLGLAVIVVLVALAGVTIGAAGSGEVVAVARRLDRLDELAIARPLVVTRLDRMGELMAELELLRRDLAAEHQRYQDTLAQTREGAVAKAEFLAAVSHELRTPLNSICGFSQLLLAGMPTELAAEQQEDVRLIRTSGMQLLGLINDILDISMIESGELRLYFAHEDIAEIVDEVARIHRPLVQEVGLELRAEVPDGLPHVVCDRRRISQILNNLLSNATKFTERGNITVSAAYDPLAGRLLVRVADTGIGIAPEDIDAIFNEYHQVGSLSRRKQGTGLGLAIARSIATHHGGSLGVSSALGRGSVFILTLPLDPPRKPTSIDMTAEFVRASQRLRQPRQLMPEELS